MLGFFSKLFDTSDFPARWTCGLWTAGHGWLHILSDLGVWSAYVAIPIVLGYFAVRRKDIPFRRIFLLFGAFILACGATHLMEAIIFWWPAYRLAGVIKLFTALISWATVIALIQVAPKVFAMRSPEELEREIAARNQAEERLRQANFDLEQKVEALRASEERFRLLVNSTDDYAIYMLDETGKIASWNHGAEKIKQYTSEEVIGQHFSRFYPPEDVQADKPNWHLQNAIKSGRVEEEGWRIRKDGSRFCANVIITPFKDANGVVRGFTKITRDITERKRAEENSQRLIEETAARDAAEQYAQVIETQREQLRVTLSSIGDGVITTDQDGRVTLLNAIAEELTGWTNQDARGRPIEEVFPIVNRFTRQTVPNPVEAALRLKKAVTLDHETILISKTGGECPIDDSASPIKDDSGNILGVILVFRDRTEHMLAADAEQKHREILRLVHKIGKIGHWVWDVHNHQSQWSPEAEALYGLREGEFNGVHNDWLKLVHPDDVLKAKREFDSALAVGEFFCEYRVVWPDGKIHWLETRAVTVNETDGKPLRVVGVNMDVTERKRQEEAIRASELRWRSLTEAIPNLVWTALPTGQCDWLSSQWRRFTGIPEDMLLIDQWLQTVIHPDDREATRELWESACNDQRDYDLEYRIRRFDGEYRWFKTRGVPTRDESGQITYWVGSCTDIEDVKRLEKVLREADQRKDEFLATLSHELRNPLAPIRNTVELFRHGQPSAADTKAALEMMDRQLKHIVRLIDDLMDISRITRGKFQLKLQQVDLSTVIRSAVEETRHMYEKLGHTLTVQIPESPVILNADPIRLAQIISNILSNAAKYTEPDGTVNLTATHDENTVIISIKDSGIGIAPENLPEIFEMFSQVAPAIDRTQGGLGIGLSLVQGLVQMHKGTIEARSEGLGRGSEFIVRLPTDEKFLQPEATETETSNMDQFKSDRPCRVLVVDDNKDSAISLGMMLKFLGYETKTAHDGLEAIDATNAFLPDVVLLDIGLPKMNGYEVARVIRREHGNDKPILVAVTGWGQEDDKKLATEAGFNHHLTKPAELDTLMKLLKDVSSN